MNAVRFAVLGFLGLGSCSRGDETSLAVGTLERHRIELIAELQEPIVELAVKEGDAVKAGQLILKLSEDRQRIFLSSVEAARDRALARFQELTKGPRAQEIAGARAQVSAAESSLTNAEQELHRMESLARGQVATEQDLERVSAAARSAKANRDATRAALETLLVGTRREQLAAAEASLREAEAGVRDAQLTLARLSVRAPVDAHVESFVHRVGERPAPKSTVAILLSNEAPFARVFIPEPYRARVKVGAAVRITVDGHAQPVNGRVRFVSSEAAFTPYYSLTERDRSRLAYLAEVELTDPQVADLPTGIPVEVALARD